jgi:hypothetical protein
MAKGPGRPTRQLNHLGQDKPIGRLYCKTALKKPVSLGLTITPDIEQKVLHQKLETTAVGLKISKYQGYIAI